MISNAENFLSMKLDELSSKFNTEGVPSYKGYYADVSNNDLKEIFALIHYQLNELFTFMNHKNTPAGGHYNADESRDLIEVNRQLKLIHAALESEYPEYSFDINNYYREILNRCKTFLVPRGGTSIPEDFPEIDIIDYKAIFSILNTTTIQPPIQNLSVTKKLIGSGSYADVYKYKDPHYNCYFALKKVKKDIRSDELARFKKEYYDLKKLDSPFIIKAYHYNETNNEYTMEKADCSLEEYMNKNNNRLSFNDRRALVIQLLRAFEYIHSKELLHRDISFQNILVKIYEDESSWIKVSDFGLVKRPESKLTRTGTEIKGTINDFSDLNKVGFENYEIRHETYALAQVIYFILTGRKSKFHREENKELRNLILKAVSNKEDRFSSVKDMRDELLYKVFPSMRN
ncbi:protein kinase domain-containing protein [Lentibacillus salicampi]|uniref:Protein kinase family protein n=1 Tax=Lentibacillus salicampi TaxID=175306 RepID=A0A4Y9A690_9BACI|nr:protein kinase [Lentibacillus salicampi]TFJ90261.1 protein kinase family protein [Lentibacillus salicampi]